MQKWGESFTCIAPDTPGFGQSDPLPVKSPDIDHYSDAVAAFVAALGIQKTVAYGFHSGGIILVNALKRHPHLFSGLAVGGYAVWSEIEMKWFGESYLPEFHPSDYGEHLTWLWNRILEQTWFFPWFDIRDESRLIVAHDDPEKVHNVILDMLDAGNSYQDGYGAVLRAPRDIPAIDADVPPCLITAYDGDPLQEHIDRLGEMPAGWSAQKVKTPQEQEELSHDFLTENAAASPDSYAEDSSAGFIAVKTERFDGLIHWQGAKETGTLHLHSPGREAALVQTANGIAIDLPGHGLSDNWRGEAPEKWNDWQAVINIVVTEFGCDEIQFAPLPEGDPGRLYPDLTPDRFGGYLTTAWQIVRARHFFSPWYEANAENAVKFDPNDLTPAKLALEHRALIRARSAKAYHLARLEMKGSPQ